MHGVRNGRCKIDDDDDDGDGGDDDSSVADDESKASTSGRRTPRRFRGGRSGEEVQNRIFLNNFLAKSAGEKKKRVEEVGAGARRLSSSESDPEDGVGRNPMFPQLY